MMHGQKTIKRITIFLAYIYLFCNKLYFTATKLLLLLDTYDLFSCFNIFC
jgi:hypothetical protein